MKIMGPKKIKTLFFILISVLSCSVYSGQVIQVVATLPMDSSDANLMFIIDDLDSGMKTPVSMYLHAGNNVQTFAVSGDHYQVIPVKLLAPLQEFVPCSPSAIIDHRALIMTIMGKIAPNQLHCSYRETASLAQLYPSQENSKPKMTSSLINNKNRNGLENYLTALSKNCAQGDFDVDYGGKKIEYTILGLKSGQCEVTINLDQNQKPLLCRFTADDIAIMASPTRITQASQGSLTYSEQDLTTKIMNAHCHTL